MSKIATLAPSVKEQCLRYIVHQVLEPTGLRDFALNRDIVIGLIGDRGSGKSVGGSQIIVRDGIVRGEPCFANIGITPQFEISDEMAQAWCGAEYGLKEGGTVSYSSQELDIYKFLQFSDEYRNGWIFIDEINIALADARRSMSYQNLGAADIGQQLRKLRSGFIYTCISEAFVDVRIRDITDFVIKSHDALFSRDNKIAQCEGEYFTWTIYPVTEKAAYILRTYQRYIGPGKGVEPVTATISGKSWWGIIDTWQHQQRRKYKGNVTSGDVNESIHENQEIVVAKRDWGWLEKVAQRIVEYGMSDSGMVPAYEVMQWPEVIESGLSQRQLTSQLNSRFNIWTKYHTIDGADGRRGMHYVANQAVFAGV